MVTQDFSRLHSQCPLSSAREHSDFLVHLQGHRVVSAPVLLGLQVTGTRTNCSPSLNDTPATVGILGVTTLSTGNIAQAFLHGEPEHLEDGRAVGEQDLLHRPPPHMLDSSGTSGGESPGASLVVGIHNRLQAWGRIRKGNLVEKRKIRDVAL